MKTSELQVGDWVIQSNGWPAQVLEKSTEQDDLCILCNVHGWCTEGGSIYCHDIVSKVELVDSPSPDGHYWIVQEGDMEGQVLKLVDRIITTPEQRKLRASVSSFFGD